jgi:hypothetical protein
MNSTNKLRVEVAKLRPSLFLIRQGTFAEDMTFWNDEGRQGRAVDPASNLDACAALEKTLTRKQLPLYFEAICVVLGIPEGTLGDLTCEEIMSIVSATAEQRCKAFVAVVKPSVTQGARVT